MRNSEIFPADPEKSGKREDTGVGEGVHGAQGERDHE